MNKKYAISIAIAACLTLGVVFGVYAFPKGGMTGAPPEAAPEKTVAPDAAVAIVNGEKIERKEFDFALRSYMNDLSRSTGGMHSGSISANDEIKNQVLDQMIDSELLTLEIRKNGGLADVDKKAEEAFEGTKKNFPSEEEYNQALASQGIDETMLKEMLKRRTEFQLYLEQKIAPSVTVSDDDVKKFYDENPQYFEQPEQVRASHILVAVDKDADKETKEKARAKAEDVHKRIVGGEDFAALAQESSDCPSAPNGGDLNFMGRGQTVEAFDKAIFSMKVGDLSDVVETEFGYHVIKVTDKKDAGKVPMSEVEARIKDHLGKTKANEKIMATVEELKKKAKIEKVAENI